VADPDLPMSSILFRSQGCNHHDPNCLYHWRYMVDDLEAQTRAAMEGIKQTLDASGASFKDVVHYFVFRARPRMGDIGKASAVINSYFAPFNHKPTSTNVAVLELGEPEQLVEIQMVAVRPRASSELSDQPDVRFGMTDFAIDPPIRILGHSGTFVRSTDQAAAFMREHMLQHVDGHATEVLRRLEDVSSAEEARDAAKAFRTWIASGLRATPKGSSTKSSSYGDKRAGALRAPRPRRSRRKETPGAVANVKRRAHIA
jgi:Endoribonuclease L-PSP